MLRLVVLMVGVFFVAVGMWFHIVKPFDKKIAETKQESPIGLKAEGKPQPLKPSVSKAQKAVLSFGENPDAYFEPGELVVTNSFKSFATAAEINGYRTIETVELTSLDLMLHRLRVPAGIDMRRARRDLAAKFPSVTVDFNHRFQAQSEGSFVYKAHARSTIGWSDTTPTCGRGTRIGMIDTAIDPDHPALKGRKIQFRSFHNPESSPGPTSHGTAIAGMLVGNTEWGGLLPGAALYAVNMFEQRRNGEIVSNAVMMMKGIDWLTRQKVHVINLSIAGADNKVIDQIVKKVSRKGIALVAAAGNWGITGKPAYPAAYKSVIAVTALNEDRKSLYAHSGRGDYIDFAAPGANIWAASFGTGGRYQSGTSLAATYITALSALYVSAGYGKTPDALRSLFRRAANDLGAPGKDPEFGWGFVNVQPKCA
ncbi:MAG: S8 family serine peptidase [Rhodospirillales bacterium]